MKRLLLLVISGILVGICATSCNPTDESSISLSEKHHFTLDSTETNLFLYWDLEKSPNFRKSILSNTPHLFAYRDTLKTILGQDLLQKLIDKEQTQHVDTLFITKADSISNHELIHRKDIGKLRKINLLEAQLLEFQLSRYPLFSKPTEFHGFILENRLSDSLRIYFAGGDKPWPPKATPLIPYIEEDITNGWKLIYHLHNHFESKDENYIGSMSASLPDVHYFKILRDRFDLSEALVTNGFSTLVLKNDEFDLLKSH